MTNLRVTDQHRNSAGEKIENQSNAACQSPGPALAPTDGPLSNLPDDILFRLDDFLSDPKGYYDVLTDLVRHFRYEDFGGGHAIPQLIHYSEQLREFFLQLIFLQQKSAANK